jgi:uncharacterized coiled-coil protein SlyX/Zn-dependent protease with chaperone function
MTSIPVLISALPEAGLRALALALAVWAGLRLFRVHSVRSQKAAWGLVLAAALLMPFAMRWQLPGWAAIRLPAHFFGLSTKPLPAAAAAVSMAAPVFEPAVKPASRLHAEPVAQPELNALATVPAHPVTNTVKARRPAVARAFHPAALAGLLYMAVCALLLARLGFGLALAMKLWITAQPVALSFGLDRFPTLRVRTCDQITSPVSVGSGVILPSAYTSWNMEKLRIVLAHERSHILQGDFYLQLLAGFYAALFWFSPLGWWLKRKLTDLGEALSDHAGQEEAASRVSYVQILLEFAALPRPTLIGVAMASTSNLSPRIERLLNESSFRQAFSGNRRRALAAVLLVPIALFAATALVRVEAAGQAAEPPAPPAALAVTASAPAAEPAGVEAPEPPEASQDSTNTVGEGQPLAVSKDSDGRTIRQVTGHGYSYSYSSNGNSYALVTGPGENITFSSNWNANTKGTLDKARRLAHGKFLWFTRNGKSYIVDDAAAVAQIEAMYKPMEALARQQEELGRQQEKLGAEQERLGRLQEQASVPTPDISKEMAELNAAMAKLHAKMGKTTNQEQLADLQGRIGDLQGKLGDVQGKLGEKRGAFGEQQGKLGEQQGKLGEEQGRLGEQQGRIAVEADHKVKSIIDQSLSNGKARPVE